MVRLILKLAIVGLIANAVWHAGGAWSSNYRFMDAVQQATRYRGDKTDAQIHDRVFALAGQYDVPVDDDTLTIRREGDRTIIDGSYTRGVELIPGYIYHWPFIIHLDTPTVDPLKVDSPIR